MLPEPKSDVMENARLAVQCKDELKHYWRAIKEWFIGLVLTETLLQKPKSKRNAWFSTQHLLSKQSSSPNKLPPPRISVTESQGCPSIHICLSKKEFNPCNGWMQIWVLKHTLGRCQCLKSLVCNDRLWGSCKPELWKAPHFQLSTGDQTQHLTVGVILNWPGCTMNSQSNSSKSDCHICCDKGYAHKQNEEKHVSY